MTPDGDQASPLASVKATREVLERFGLHTNKALGQHFLINDGIVRKTLALAEVDFEDTVLEIGPGIGTLTTALLKRGATVIAVERDAKLIPVLESVCAPWRERLTLIQGDALELTPQSDRLLATPFKLVSNLPYAVAATLVLNCFERFSMLTDATVMVQREVYERMCAHPSTKAYGAYTVKLALYAKASKSFSVGAQSFFPPPHVESAVVRFDQAELSPPVTKAQRLATAVVADAAFFSRRKTLQNALRGYFSSRGKAYAAVLDVLPDVLAMCDIDPSRRGETLTLQEFSRLGWALAPFLP